jgi:serine/threonine protein kinase/tetratricopeptide (TPR) repeat protein
VDPDSTSSALELFDQLVVLPVENRLKWLDEHDTELDPSTRDELKSLLAAYDDAGEFLSDTSVTRRSGALDPHIPGTRIGAYELIELIGEGGFARVFRAQQTRPLRREVAVKIVKLGMDTRAVIARFELERQALALMAHPNIAAVHDAGATDTGRPYFVMELVRDGRRITGFCDEHDLDIRQRVALFVDVCQAIQHAHEKGVLHRDLKPSNILVTTVDGRSTPKVIDFGIAKAIHDQRLTDATLVTKEQQLLGTPQYMSPEQARTGGADVDTRSDIFSLGAVLYELLAGRPPLDVPSGHSSAMQQLQRLTSDQELPPPSTRAGAERARQLRGELDWIVGKCVEKDRSRRYDSAAALAADLRAWLQRRPITAAPPAALYRAKKFIARNMAAVVAVSIILATLLAGSIVSTALAVRARRAERLAQSRLDDSVAANAELKAVNDFLTHDMIGSADPATMRGRELPVREALDKAAASAATKFKDRPLTQAVILHSIASAYLSLGRSDLASPPAQQAMEIRKRLLGDGNPETIASLAQYSQVLKGLGKFSEAEPLARAAMDRSAIAIGEDHPDTIRARRDYAAVLMALQRWRDAEVYEKRALDQLRRISGDDHLQTIESMNDYAMIVQNLGRTNEAVPIFRDALERSRRTCGDDHPLTSFLVHNLAIALENLGQYAGAEELYRQALELRRRLYGADNQQTLTTLNNYALVLERLHRRSEAQELMKEALDRRRRALGENHPDTIASMNNYASILRTNGHAAEAEPYAREALEKYRQTLGDDHPSTITALNNYGVTLAYGGKSSEATPLYKEVLDRRRRLFGDDNPQTLQAMFNYASNLNICGRFAESEPISAELYGKVQHAQADPVLVAMLMCTYGPCLAKLGRYEEAEAPLREAYRRMQETHQTRDLRARQLLAALIDVCDHTNRPEEASKLRVELQSLQPATRPTTRPAATTQPPPATSLAHESF